MKNTFGLLTILSLLSLAPACVMDEAGLDEEDISQMSHELSVSGYLYSLPARGGNGGRATSLNCAPGYVAVGIYGRSGALIDNIGLTCAFLNANGSLSSSYDTGAVGGSGGSAFRRTCPSGQAIVGFYGRSGSLVDQLGLACAGVSSWRIYGSVEYFSTTTGGSGGQYFYDRCPVTYVATRLNVRTGALVDQEQLVCAYIRD